MDSDNMNIVTGNKVYEEIKGKRTIYVLLSGTTEISLLDGVSAAGEKPELTPLTPPLDSEIIFTGKCKSYDVMPMTDNGIPTPAIITRASNEISKIDTLIVDAGLKEYPKIPFIYTGLGSANNFTERKALDRYNEAVSFGEYIGKILDGKYDYILLAESVPGGTTTAYAVLSALNINYMTSSSMRDSPDNIKRELIKKAFKRIEPDHNPEHAIEQYGDYMMALSIGISRKVRKSTLLFSGGTQMLNVYLLDQMINKTKDKRYIFTTKYIMNDKKELMEKIGGDNIIYSNMDFSNIDGLNYYEQGYVKEGTGFGATFGIAYLNCGNVDYIYDEIKKVYASFLR